MADYDIGEAFKAIEDELIASMIRNMDRHRAEETKEGIQWSMWQAEQLKSLEKYKRENQRRYGKKFKDINGQIEALIRQSRDTGNMQQEIQILDAIRKGFFAQKVSQGGSAEFFRLNDRKLESLIEATTHDMQQAETAVLRMANDQYRKAIFNAQVYANSGAGTYEQAVDMATKDMLAAGLNCVQYANGADDAGFMACGLQNGAHHERGGRFALGARDTDDVHLLCGVAEELGAQICEGKAGILR